MDSNTKIATAEKNSHSSSTSVLRRIERFLDGRTWIVLVFSPIVIAISTGYAVWWYLASKHSVDSNVAFGATFITAACVFLFGVILSLYLNTLFKRFNRLRSALNVVDASLIIYDKNRQVVQFNKSAYEYHKKRSTKLTSGMSESLLIKKSADRRFTDLADKQAWIIQTMLLRQQHTASGEPITVSHKSNDDQATDLHQQVLLAQLENGEHVEMRTDVTALKSNEFALAERERELEKSRDEAQASNRSKSEFLANMSHEIRTPMNGVVGMTELLLDSDLTDNQRRYASTVSTSAQALLTLINDILDFSKVEAGKLELDPQAFDMRRMFDDVAAMLAVRTHSKGVELVMNYSPDLPARFIGDEGRLRQIITNLAGNAVKFTDNGHVVVQVTPVINDQAVVSDLTKLRVEINDTGIGIPLDKQEHVFRMFEQVDGASNRRFEGSGLGLAISRRLLQLMGTDISLQSEPGVGSTFSFEFDLPADKNQLREKNAVSNVDLAGLTVLIVDDLPLNTEILSRRMQIWGMQPIVALSGEEALELAKKHTIDLALIDFQMPVMDGHELCSAFKADPALAGIPIVLISSVDQSVQGERVRELGFSDTMVKPVRTEVLFEKVTKALSSDQYANNKTNGTVSDRQHNLASSITGTVPNEKNQLVNSNTHEQTQHSARILVVEDNLVNQMVILGMLEKLGLTPDIANNGQEGLEDYCLNPPDLVFMDVSMPILNGMEATHAIRDFEIQNGKARCPIIALTANAMKGDRERCIESGMDDFLTKPVLMDDLSLMLNRWLNQSQNQAPEILSKAQGL